MGSHIMPSHLDLSGRWIGHYWQGGHEHPITADLVQNEQRLSGSMFDGKPDRDCSLFEATHEAGLPPGADEQITARLREVLGDAPVAPIRSVSHLPSDSVLEGWRKGGVVYLLKTYRGTSFSGFKIGDRLLGIEREGHKVHYEGNISPDGLLIDGRWWIDADPARGVHRTQGLFVLRRGQEDQPFHPILTERRSPRRMGHLPRRQ